MLRKLAALSVIGLIVGLIAFPAVASGGENQTIFAKALDDHDCDSSEWHFVINQIDTEANTPASISVTFSGGETVVVPLEKFTGGVAHYTTMMNLDETVVQATAVIYASWPGQFNLSHGPCSGGTTTSSTSSTSSTSTSTSSTSTSTTSPSMTTTHPTTTTTQPTTTTTAPTTTTTRPTVTTSPPATTVTTAATTTTVLVSATVTSLPATTAPVTQATLPFTGPGLPTGALAATAAALALIGALFLAAARRQEEDRPRRSW